MRYPIITFNAGKLTPLIDVRSDTEKYSAGCRQLQNMIPLIYGPVTRRPGTKYIADCADHDVKSRMVPFVYSSNVTYELEFGDQVINVYYEGELVQGDISSPYLEDDLFELQFRQSADVMWIVHSSYKPRKLSRVSATSFTLAEIPFENGPFLERNDIAEDDGVTISVTGYTIATATNGAAGAGNFTITSSTDISGLFPANQRFYVSGSTGNDGPYTVHATTATTYSGTTCTIYTNEAISDGTDDGQIMVDGGTVALTSSKATFVTGSSGHVDSLFKLTHKREQTSTTGNTNTTAQVGEIIDVKGNWSFTTHGNWEGSVELQRMEDGTNWEVLRTYTSVMTGGKGSRNIQKSDTEEADGVQYRIYGKITDGTLYADLIVDESTQHSIYKITAVTNTSEATATAIIAANEHDATVRWAEGAWSHVRGWPSAITFFEERAVYGFTNSDAQDIWLSGTGDFEDFDTGTDDTSAFTLTLPTSARGQWLAALEILAAGTTDGEWRIGLPTRDEPITPTNNWAMKQQTAIGSANLQPIEVGNALLFVDYAARKIREYVWHDTEQKYVAPDLTALAEDITSGGITCLGVQKRPDTIIWFTIANSPYLISMTYEREQDVVAFAEHPLGGDGIVESFCITPGSDEDTITLSVRRTINRQTRRYIEQMQPRDWGSDQSDAFFVDCGITDTTGLARIDNLGHLEGKTVKVLVDGATQDDKTVEDGSITLDATGGTVHVGLGYTWIVEPMRMDTNSPAGTTHGRAKKIPEIVISFYQTGAASYGDGVDTYTIPWRSTEDYDTPPALFTGDKEVAFDGGFSTDDAIEIRGDDPVPATVRAIIPKVEVTEP